MKAAQALLYRAEMFLIGHSVDSIINSLTRRVDALRSLSAKLHARADALHAEAEHVHSAALDTRVEAQRAERVAGKIADLTR